MTVLTTRRLRLRPLEQSDSDAVFGMMSDDETMRFWDWPAFTDLAQVAEIVAGHRAAVRSGNAIYWAACPLDGGAPLGVCDLSEIDEHHRRAELGFLFGRAHWRKGYAHEGIERIIVHAFGPLGIERLGARFHVGNTASRALLIRLGFVREGTLKGYVLREGERLDCEIYGRLR